MYPILNKEKLNAGVGRMEILAPLAARHARAGQFVILRADERGERIPLTIAASDKERGTVTVIYQIVGGATMALDRLNAGECVADLTGPLGKPSAVEGLGRVAVVGGGVGCAIALPIVRALHEQGSFVAAIAGFRTAELVILEAEFSALADEFYLTTDDGTRGERGNVCMPLSRLLAAGEKFDAVFTIGPLPMMKFVAQTTKPYALRTVASMNPIMIDGTGMCGCCRLTVGGARRFACVDGPEFDAHLIDFDEAIARAKTYRAFEAAARERHCNLYRQTEKRGGTL